MHWILTAPPLSTSTNLLVSDLCGNTKRFTLLHANACDAELMFTSLVIMEADSDMYTDEQALKVH